MALPENVVMALLARPDAYRQGLLVWLGENEHVWARFAALADRIRIDRKRAVYSARTIVEVMRWQTDVGEVSGPWKLNNNWVPSLARIYNAIHAVDFFQERVRAHAVQPAPAGHPHDRLLAEPGEGEHDDEKHG